jgi:MraZ protein
MNRFVSNFTNKLDSKGRVSIPATFRAALARDGFEGLYVHPALDSPALDAGGNALLNEIDAFLSTLSPYSDERDQLSTALFGTSEILKVDPEGRVILTESVKLHAGIKDAVSFVGLGHKFQIWEPEQFRAHLEEARAKVRELKRTFGVRDLTASRDAASPAQASPPGARER